MKQVPEFKTDAEAEAFLEQDLSDLDFSQFKPMRFELKDREGTLNLPTALENALRARARAKGIPYVSYIRMVLEADVRSGQ